jgi:hypothetical protein
MAANPDISLIDYLPPVKVTPNEEKSSADSPKLKPALTPIEKKLAGKTIESVFLLGLKNSDRDFAICFFVRTV